MQSYKYILPIALGIFISAIISASSTLADTSNILKWKSYGWESLTVNIAIYVVVLILSIGFVLLILKSLRDIDRDREAREAKRNEEHFHNLVEALKTTLKDNNAELIKTIRDVLKE
jgi:hypothetical protein